MVARAKRPDLLIKPAVDGGLIGCKEAAAMLAVSDRTVWAMAKRGELPCVRFADRIVRFDPADLAAWIKSRKTADAAACRPESNC